MEKLIIRLSKLTLLLFDEQALTIYQVSVVGWLYCDQRTD